MLDKATRHPQGFGKPLVSVARKPLIRRCAALTAFGVQKGVFLKSVFLAAGIVSLSNQTRGCLSGVKLVAENSCSATVKGMYECSATICTENGGTHPHCGRLLYLDHAGLPVWPCKGRDERRFKPGFLAPSTLRSAQLSYRLCGWNGHLRSWPIASIQKFERACGTTWLECSAEFLNVSVIADRSKRMGRKSLRPSIVTDMALLDVGSRVEPLCAIASGSLSASITRFTNSPRYILPE
jgi:hypothetical protein